MNIGSAAEKDKKRPRGAGSAALGMRKKFVNNAGGRGLAAGLLVSGLIRLAGVIAPLESSERDSKLPRA